VAGDFDGDEIDDVVVGVPRGNELFGMVCLALSTIHFCYLFFHLL
jgi:hypothetical protein